MRRAPEILKEGVQKAAMFWHERNLPKHFIRGAGVRYGYAERTRKYLKRKKNKPHLVFSGGMEQQIKSRATFKIRQGGVDVRMTARALNFVPNVAESLALKVRHTDGRMYPNIKREIKVVTTDERVEMANIVEDHVRREFKKAQN